MKCCSIKCSKKPSLIFKYSCYNIIYQYNNNNNNIHNIHTYLQYTYRCYNIIIYYNYFIVIILFVLRKFAIALSTAKRSSMGRSLEDGLRQKSSTVYWFLSCVPRRRQWHDSRLACRFSSRSTSTRRASRRASSVTRCWHLLTWRAFSASRAE